MKHPARRVIRRSYLRFYDRPAAWAPLVFLWDYWFLGTPNAPRSFQNRMKDYMALLEQPERRKFHRKLQEVLEEQTREWDSYDYGEGYFYQSCARLGISGLRHSEARVAAMGLCERVAGRRVLEIGCNTGFLSLLLSPHASRVTGFDINPYLIRIAHLAAAELKCENAEFVVSRFEDFQPQQNFEVVLSFANHSTYDGNTAQSIRDYFARCRELLVPGGSLLFESHPPQHEGEGLKDVLAILGELFRLEQPRVLAYAGGVLDRGRTFAVAVRD